MASNKSNIMASVLIGTAIGATLGILFAPYKGKKTRRKIKKKAIATSHDVRESMAHTKDELTSFMHEKKVEFDKKLDSTVSKLSYKAGDIINNLEEKLEELKRKNSTYQK